MEDVKMNINYASVLESFKNLYGAGSEGASKLLAVPGGLESMAANYQNEIGLGAAALTAVTALVAAHLVNKKYEGHLLAAATLSSIAMVPFIIK